MAEPKATENVTEIETKKEDEQKIVAEIASEVADENLTKDQIEETAEEAPVDVDFGAIFEMAAENPGEIEEEASLDHEVAAEVQIEEIQAETKQISFEDLLGENYSEPVFVKPNEITKPASKKEIIEDKTEVIVEAEKSKSKSLNDRMAKTINIGLNDRMGFVKHLFSESNEDFNRVLSQLNTFTTFEEARDFIEEIIKPDYNNWEGVDDYAERFIEIVEKRFD